MSFQNVTSALTTSRVCRLTTTSSHITSKNIVRRRSSIAIENTITSATKLSTSNRFLNVALAGVGRDYNKMKAPYNPLKVLLLAAFATDGNALPFRGRGFSTNSNDDEANDDHGAGPVADAVMQGDIIHISPHITHGGHRRSVALEEYQRRGDETSSLELRDEIKAKASNMTNFLIQTRRALHKMPELMYNEEKTSAYVQSVLTELEIPYTTGWAVNKNPDVQPGPGGYGIVADIGTGSEPCVLLRADMDALPILEKTEGVDEFKSQNENRMHACGHDGHTAMLLGAAAILKGMEDSINGTIRLMFQPAEEGGAGAKRMREEGVLQLTPQPQHAFGIHLWPTIPSGVVAGRPGPILASCERFEILISGVGGHAAMPHMTVDPIVTASAIIMNLQTVVSRNVNPLDAGVCSITKFEAGDAFNIIPASALLRGTIRSLSTETLLTLRDRVHHIVEATAAVYGCSVTIEYSHDYYPPTVNDPELYETFAKHVGALVSDDGKVLETEPTMGAEDFSFLAQSIPSTFFLLGQGSGTDPPTNYGLHHPRFAIHESVLPMGVELHANLALRALQKLVQGNDATAVAA